jgi:hypothetical protein
VDDSGGFDAPDRGGRVSRTESKVRREAARASLLERARSGTIVRLSRSIDGILTADEYAVDQENRPVLLR